MNKIKELALEKMLVEMNEQHNRTEDVIHNWLCEQEDNQLLEAIMKEDRSIHEAMGYCTSKAKELKDGNVAMVDDETVWGWVREYFLADKVKVTAVSGKMIASGKPSVKKEIKKEHKPTFAKNGVKLMDGEQLDLFGDLI